MQRNKNVSTHALPALRNVRRVRHSVAHRQAARELNACEPAWTVRHFVGCVLPCAAATLNFAANSADFARASATLVPTNARSTRLNSVSAVRKPVVSVLKHASPWPPKRTMVDFTASHLNQVMPAQIVTFRAGYLAHKPISKPEGVGNR